MKQQRVGPRRRWMLLVAAAAAAAVVLAAAVGGAAMLGGGAAEPPVLLVRVERRPFLRTATAEGTLRAVSATPITVPPEAGGMQRIEWLADNGAEVAQGEVVVRLDPASLQRDLADGQTDLQIAQARIRGAGAKSRAARDNLLLDAGQAERELQQQEQFLRRDEKIYSRHELIDSEIDRDMAQTRAENARARSEVVARQGRTELELLGIEKSKAELKIRQAQRGLSVLTVTAPHAGMLVVERNWRGEMIQAGMEVWPGMKMGELPDPSRMQAQCYVLEADAAGLAKGLTAELVVESHPQRRFRALVENVDALAKRKRQEVPVQYFEVTLLPDETDQKVMKPGGRVRAEILLERVDSALVVPRQALVERGGRAFVYRWSGGRLEPVEVRRGPQSLALAVIEQGLEEGEQIALHPPLEEAGEAEAHESAPAPAPASSAASAAAAGVRP
jgi:HlyD family secretion protein